MQSKIAQTHTRGFCVKTEDFANINSVFSWDSGGGIILDIVELKDGRVLAISDELVMLYDNIEDLETGDASKERPQLFL